MAIVLNNVTSGYNLSTINSNFQKIEDYVNDKLLARADTGVSGEAMMARSLDMNGNKILNVFVDVNDAGSLLTVGAADTRYYNVAGDVLEGDLNAGGFRLTNVGSPLQSSDAVTKGYTDSVDSNLQQQINANQSRALRVPEAVEMVPTIAGRKNKILAFNDTGNPIAVLPESGSAADVMIELAKNTGFSNIGQVPDYATLKLTVPTYAGQKILLASYNTGTTWGGGEFIAQSGVGVEDGGVNCVVDSSWYWKRVLPENKIDVTMFGCDPTGSTECHGQLMNALNYSAAHGVLLTQSGVTLVGQSVIAPTGIIIDFSGYVVMTDATNLETTYGGYAWVQGAYRGTTTDAYTNIKNLKLSTSLDDLMRGAPRTSPFDGKGLCVMEYITHGYIYTAGFQYGGVYIAKEKGAMRGDMVECYVRARPSNDDKYSKAYGFYNAGADTKIDKLKCIKYARGAWTGDFSYFGVVHCWGLPALISTDPNAEGYKWGTMLAGLFLGTSSYVGYFYCDTPETTGYDVAAVYDDAADIYMGYGLVLVGYESMIDNYMFLIYKDSQKTKKCRIAHYKDGRNQHKIGYLTCHDGALFDDTNAITYANKNQDFFQNYIDNLSGAYLHQYIDTWSANAATHVVFNGVTSHNGTVKYVRRGQSLDVYLNVTFSAVDTSASSFDMKFVNIPTQVLTQSSTMPVHNITTWGGVSRPPAAVDTLNVMNGASQVGTVSVPRNLSGLSISSVTNGLITFKFVDIANGTAWNVSPSQLRVGGLIMSLSMCI